MGKGVNMEFSKWDCDYKGGGSAEKDPDYHRLAFQYWGKEKKRVFRTRRPIELPTTMCTGREDAQVDQIIVPRESTPWYTRTADFHQARREAFILILKKIKSLQRSPEASRS